MISAVRTDSSLSVGGDRKGFSLIEIMVVLGLIGLLIGIGAIAFTPDGPNEKFDKSSSKLEGLAARGHTMARLHQQPFWLKFENGRVSLQGAPLREASQINGLDHEDGRLERGPDLSRGGRSERDVEEQQVQTFDTYEYPEDVKLFVRRWGADLSAWLRQERLEDEPIYWRFDQNGLCEPLSLRLELEESWMELEMNPLTAMVSDKTSEVVKK